MVAIALGFPDQRDVIGATKTPPSGKFRIVGSGFLVDRKHGLVITAGHVVEQLKQARIAAELQEKPLPNWLCVPQQRGIIDGEGDFAIRFHSVYVKGFFHGGPPDVGVVEIDSEGLGAHNDSLELSAEPCLEGDAVFTCGYPLGLELHKNSTVNATFITAS